MPLTMVTPAVNGVQSPHLRSPYVAVIPASPPV